MTRDRSDVDAIKRARVDPMLVGEKLPGIDPWRDGANVKGTCPRHGGDSLNLRIGPDGTLQVKCYGCGDLSGDIFDLVAAVHRLDRDRDFARVKQIAADLAGVRLEGMAARRMPAPSTSQRPIPTMPKRHPRAEVGSMWSTCLPACEDVDINRQLAARAINPFAVTDGDLARALVASTEAPRWASYDRRTWLELGRRLIVPMYDADGALAALHARTLAAVQDDVPKGLSAAGASPRGTVFACALARRMLAGAPDALETVRRNGLLVSEGVPDFLTNATHYSDADEHAPAVLGVIAGSWTEDIAARVPDGTRVVIRTHGDDAGEKYATTIGMSLVERCQLFRPRHPLQGDASR